MKNIFLLALVIITFSACNQQGPKTAYINNTKVVSDFKDMKAIQEKWTQKSTELQTELEQKARQFQIEVEGYNSIKKSMTTKNREKREIELRTKQQQLQREQQMKMQEMQVGSQKEIDSVIQIVKDFIKDYGKKNGYTYIYGDTEVSNLLYAKEELDLTDKVLTELNGEAPDNKEK